MNTTLVDTDATEIGKLYAASRTNLVESVRCAWECGCRLKAKKDSLDHGEWLPWLEEHAETLGFTNRSTATRLIKLANGASTHHLEASEAAAVSRQIWDNTGITHGTQGTGVNEWYTPSEHIEAARAAMGAIDLDPATSEHGQKTVCATKFYTEAENGLEQKWQGRVWLNPPYSQPIIGHFIDKLVSELACRTVTQAILLTHNYTDTAWFHTAEGPAEAICFTRGRVKFLDIKGEPCAPTQGQAFFYYGPNKADFITHFTQFGFIR